MPLTSLSLCGPEWMTDSHIEAIMPIIGKNLVRLELVDCSAWDHESPIDSEGRLLSDISIISIAQHCKKLKTFSMTTSSITCRGLERLLSSNAGIKTLNLSDSQQLEPRAVDIISRYLPRLEVLRNYWPNKREPDWLTDDSLIALVDAQERESGGSGIFLKLLGLYAYDHLNYEGPKLTIRGIKCAIEKGVGEIEIDKGDLYYLIVCSGAKVYEVKDFVHFIDGSKHSSRKKIF